MKPKVILKVKKALVRSVYHVTGYTVSKMVSFRPSQLTGSKQSIYNNLYCAVNRVYSAPEGLVAR
jgi:hypothetical protein